MLVFFAVLILALTLVVIHIRVGVNFYLDLFGNDGFIKIYIFGIRVFKAAVHFEHSASNTNNLIIEHGKKTGKIHLNTDTKDKKSIAAMMKNPAFSNVLVQKVSAHFTVGRTNDSFFTVALLQTFRVLFYAVMAVIKCRYDVKITESFKNLKEHKRKTVKIGISIADIIVSLAGSKLKKQPRKLKKQEVAKI